MLDPPWVESAQLADYFLGVWGFGALKSFEYTNQQRQRFGLESTYSSGANVRGVCGAEQTAANLYEQICLCCYGRNEFVE